MPPKMPKLPKKEFNYNTYDDGTSLPNDTPVMLSMVDHPQMVFPPIHNTSKSKHSPGNMTMFPSIDRSLKINNSPNILNNLKE
jgi:hypothetical protein